MIADLLTSLALVVLVSVLMIVSSKRRQRPRVADLHQRLDAFLKLHPGALEVRPAQAPPTETVLLASPTAERIIDLLASDGGEVWSLHREEEGASFIRVPGSGERDRS